MPYKDLEKRWAYQLEYQRIWRERNKEKIKKKRDEYYQKNRETINQKSRSYAQKNTVRIKEYRKEYHAKLRLEVLAKIDPTMKCVMCGCDDTRFLEVNHIKGGGKKEQQRFKGDNHGSSQNIIMLIHKGKRDVEDLNLLCRVCNSIDHLERVYGKTGLRVEWDKQVTK